MSHNLFINKKLMFMKKLFTLMWVMCSTLVAFAAEKEYIFSNALQNSTNEAAELVEDYNYDEPTIIKTSGQTGHNAPYTFIQNNIKVSVTTGAQTDTYFGCNADHSITFEAAKEIKGIVIKGFVKKDFEASVDNGKIDFAYDTEKEVEADPVVVVKDINNKSVTIKCVKQLRCYEVRVYFAANPEAEIADDEEDGDAFSFDYEPTEVTNMNLTFDKLIVADYTSSLLYKCVDLTFSSDTHLMDLLVYGDYDAETGVAQGTYNINGSLEEGTVVASIGGDESFDNPSFIGTNFTEDGYYTTTYYIASGTFTVSKENGRAKFEIDATTHFGSTVKAVYTGDITIVSGITELKTADKNVQNGKFLKDGKLVILKNGKAYNVQGIEVK